MNFAHFDPIEYYVLAAVFALVIAYMFVYSIRLKTRERTIALKGRPPVSEEEGIAVATMEKEREGRTGTIT
jgi:hypothetical protein